MRPLQACKVIIWLRLSKHRRQAVTDYCLHMTGEYPTHISPFAMLALIGENIDVLLARARKVLAIAIVSMLCIC